jgi:hypothetical protein
MTRALAIAVGVLALAGLGRAQIEIIQLPQGFVIEGMPQIQAAAAATPDGEEGDESSSERLQKLKALKFDRRPSVILKTWSTPPKPPEEEEEEAEEEAPAEEVAEEVAATEEEAEPAEEEGAETEPAEELTEEEAAEAAAKAEAEAEEKRKAEEAAGEAAAEAARKEAEAKALTAEIELFQRNVTLGLWDDIRTYLAGLTEEEAKTGYQQLLKSLVEGPPKPRSQFVRWAEKNHFDAVDIVGLAAAAAHELEESDLQALGKLFAHCVAGGVLLEELVGDFHAGLDSGEWPRASAEAARIVMEAGHPIEAGEFLPPPEEAIEADERATLNLLSRHYLAMHDQEEKGDYLEQAWSVLQAVLASGEVEDKDKEEALKRAVEIAPKVRDELGEAWLDESFTARPERGMEIVSVIGAGASTGMMEQARNADYRTKSLEVQTTAVEALLAAAPELAGEWGASLNLLANNWLTEALYSYVNDESTSRGPALQRDNYGNFFYYNYSRRSSSQNQPLPVPVGELLDMRPSEAWLALISDGLRPKIDVVVAQLLLKVNEEDEAFPHIERLASSHPERGEELVAEFLRVWTKNHDPNSSNRTNSYMFIYGFERRANAIPLTRSKQERNLKELGEWVARLRQLPVELDEELVSRAFTTAHSSAEVYKVETIERVFGPLDSLETETLAAMVQRMRSNLVGVWRQPSTQEDAKTRRRQKDIQAEVLRGYEVARTVVERGLERHPDDWSLTLARASVLHDENNYLQEIQKTTEFAGRRGESFEVFQHAAELYAAKVGELSEEEETANPYITWYYASLGACDLNAIDHEHSPVPAQHALIRDAIEALPEGAAERHMDQFANSLFTRMSSVNPAVKFGYVRSGLEIVGDNERAEEARDVYEYYRDLVTEIRLEARVDGGNQVGHGEPFGVFVDIRHTREIEREAGGFSKYLVNQNDQRFSWNYGRPTENYRDKFEEAAREALDEHFDVLSVTFNHPDTHSHALEEYGWRVTPYAYVLLQARGPEVDRIPPLRLDLDFLDTSGYALLPAESSPVAIDCADEVGASRPFEDLQLTQTLDERQADEGKLLLEVKGQALGLVPALDQVLDLASPGFEVTAVDDQGVSVSEYDQEAEGTAVLTERTWMVSLAAEEGLAELPTEFHFGAPREDLADEDATLEYQRFVDADLESVEPIVSLEASYGERDLSSLGTWLAGGAVLLILGLGGYLYLRRTETHVATDTGFRVPDNVSAFTVIGLLRDIHAQNGISNTERDELLANIETLESHYFGEDGAEAPDLRKVAERWVARSGARRS